MRISLRTFFIVFTLTCLAMFFVSRWFAPRETASHSKGVRVIQYEPLPEGLLGQIRGAAERSLQVEGYTFGKSRFRASPNDPYQKYGYKLPNAFGSCED